MIRLARVVSAVIVASLLVCGLAAWCLLWIIIRVLTLPVDILQWADRCICRMMRSAVDACTNMRHKNL